MSRGQEFQTKQSLRQVSAEAREALFLGSIIRKPTKTRVASSESAHHHQGGHSLQDIADSTTSIEFILMPSLVLESYLAFLEGVLDADEEDDTGKSPKTIGCK